MSRKIVGVTVGTSISPEALKNKMRIGSDWNAAEGEPGHILNRTHWTEGGNVEILPETNMLVDEGEGSFYTTGNIPLVDGAEITVSWNGTPYKCGTYAFTPHLETGKLVVFGNSGVLAEFAGMETEENDAPFVGLYSAIQSMLMMLPLDESSEATVAIYSAVGKVHKLDNKYLDLDWLPVIKKKDILPLQTVEITNTTDQKLYWVYIPYDGPAFEYGQEVTVEVDGVPYDRVIGGSAIDGYFVTAGAVIISQAGNKLIVHNNGASRTSTLRIYVPDHNKMPVEYLPEEVGTVKTVNGVAPDENGNVEIAIPDSDWNAPEGEPGHILNRPFYLEKGNRIVEETTLYGNHSGDGILNLTLGKEYLVIYNGTEYIFTAKVFDEFEGEATFIGLGNHSLLYAGAENTGEPIVIATDTFEGGYWSIYTDRAVIPYTVSVYEIDKIVKIDKKYLPDNIGGSGGNVDLGVTGATVGQTVKISAVDENGVPTAWESVDFPTDEHINSLINIALGVIENGTY